MKDMFECGKCRIVYQDSSKCLICGTDNLPEEMPREIPYMMRDYPV